MPERPALLQLGRVSERMAERLAAGFDVVRLPPDHEAFLAEHGSEFVAIATMRGVPDHMMARLPNLKVISSFGVGYDNIDAVVAARRGILVAHTPDVLNDEVADTAIMLW
ncbi:MAG: 2-hydroxyacid dehydrogenase, partial [Boseongicola sp.]|nr:2-hydroxyacid dehydrogenase [Boseongicola sp.]